MKFEWDKKKNLVNIKKHGISFEEAVYIFADVDSISILDDDHSDIEERWITIGQIKNHGIIIVVHTERFTNEFEFIRIISARKADKFEIEQYLTRLGGEQMKKSYDFTNGIKGKFYIPENEIELPIYLDKENQEFFMNLAREKKTVISKLVNKILTKDRELINTIK